MAQLKYTKQSGRKAIVSLITEGELLSTGSLTKGTFYTVISKATTGSVLPAAVGHQFLATAAETLASGDSVLPLSNPWTPEAIFGFANSKDFSQSKNSYDQTVDWDEDADTAVEDLVNRTGNINGFVLNDAPEGCAYNKLQAEFMHSVDQNAEQDANKEMKVSSPVHLIAYIDNKDTPVAGDKVFIRFIACTMTQEGESSSYGSATTCQIAWTGASKTAAGSMSTKLAATIPSAS